MTPMHKKINKRSEVHRLRRPGSRTQGKAKPVAPIIATRDAIQIAGDAQIRFKWITSVLLRRPLHEMFTILRPISSLPVNLFSAVRHVHTIRSLIRMEPPVSTSVSELQFPKSCFKAFIADLWFENFGFRTSAADL